VNLNVDRKVDGKSELTSFRNLRLASEGVREDVSNGPKISKTVFNVSGLIVSAHSLRETTFISLSPVLLASPLYNCQ
jgi:hypothetical protein